MIYRPPQTGRRSPYDQRTLPFSLGLFVAVAALAAAGYGVYRAWLGFPLQTLIFFAVIAIAAIGIVLYIGELYVLGWLVDFLAAIGMPKIKARHVPLDCEMAGEIVVVKFRGNVAGASQCQAVARQLKQVVADRHCNFLLDFEQAGNVSRSLRGVMLDLVKSARNEAKKLGKVYQPLALPRGESFLVFEDRAAAIEAMSRHGGHGWVVLCSVPVGIRAVYEPA